MFYNAVERRKNVDEIIILLILVYAKIGNYISFKLNKLVYNKLKQQTGLLREVFQAGLWLDVSPTGVGIIRRLHAAKNEVFILPVGCRLC